MNAAEAVAAVTVRRRDPLTRFLDVWGSVDQFDPLWATLSCDEADSLAGLLQANDYRKAAQTILWAHAAADRDDCQHPKEEHP